MGTGIWSVPATSPPRSAADPRARRCLCSSSTVGPALCRHGVTDAATSTMTGGGGGGPAWPRATHPTILRPVGVARHASPTWRLARIELRRPTGHTLLEGALAANRHAYLALDLGDLLVDRPVALAGEDPLGVGRQQVVDERLGGGGIPGLVDDRDRVLDQDGVVGHDVVDRLLLLLGGDRLVL